MWTTYLILGIHGLVHVLVALLLPPLLLGIIYKTKALAAGRVGPPLLQVYYDLARLFRKDAVLSRTTTWVFLAGPVAGVAVSLVAALLVPFGGWRAPLSFTGDLVLFAYLLAMGRFLTILSALDTGSAFEGMGAAREASFSTFAEPALFLGLAALVRFSGHLSLGPMLAEAGKGWGAAGGPLILVLAAWTLVLLAETCRIPFDDPNTHLELTMIHEVMVLDHSGPPFALVTYGASVKLFVLAALVVRLWLPTTAYGALNWLLFFGAMALVGMLIGGIESVMARLKLVRIPQFLAAATLAATFGFFLLLLKPAQG